MSFSSSSAPGAWPAYAVVLVSLGLGAAARAADHVVHPGQSIQAAIQAASDGDRVLVQPGTYAEAIDFLGRAIEVVGVAGAGATTIDAFGLNTSTVTFRNGETETSLLRGFTITGGTGQDTASGQFGGGGILAALDTSPTIRECRIVGNALAKPGLGAGVLAAWTPTFQTARPTLEDCVIEANAGGGAAGSLTMRRCSVLRNTAGGVVAFHDYSLTDVLIAENVTPGDGGGFVDLSWPSAGSRQFVRCVFRANHADGRGGAYFAAGTFTNTIFASVSLADCEFVGNTAGADGGAVYMDLQLDTFFSNLQVSVARCVFASNVAGGAGGAAWLRVLDTPPMAPSITFSHCTLSENSSGIVVAGALEFQRSIAWRQQQPFTHGGTLLVANSDVQNTAPINNNFSADPLFVDASNGDLRLQAGSPCIDRPGVSPVTKDFEGDPGIGLGDVGADEFHPHLKMVGVPSPGNTVTASVIGPPGAPFAILFPSLSLAPAPVPTPYGDFLLGPVLPGFMVPLPALPASGYLGLPVEIPPSSPPANIHLQAFVATGPSSGTFTNVESVRID